MGGRLEDLKLEEFNRKELLPHILVAVLDITEKRDYYITYMTVPLKI